MSNPAPETEWIDEAKAIVNRKMEANFIALLDQGEAVNLSIFGFGKN
jgi:hypothetical protein